MVQTYDRSKTRILMAVERTFVRSLLLRALVQLGAESRRWGRAQASFLERELQRYLDALPARTEE